MYFTTLVMYLLYLFIILYNAVVHCGRAMRSCHEVVPSGRVVRSCSVVVTCGRDVRS